MDTKPNKYGLLYHAVNKFCQVFLAIQVLVVAYTVFGRFLINRTPGWGEELALLCMVWFSFLSASLAVKDDAHIQIRLLQKVIPQCVAKFLDRVFYLLNLVFSVFITIEGFKLVMLTKSGIMPGMGISTAFLYLSIPVSGVCLFLTLIGKWRDLV